MQAYAHKSGCAMSGLGDLGDLFKRLEEQSIPGGCDQCEATQTFETVSPGVHVLHVEHEDDCPAMRARSAEAN